MERIKAGFLRLFCFLALLSGVLVAVPTLYADDASVGPQGTGVVPLHNDAVEMTSERVDVYLYDGWAYVEATFVLHNTGPAVDLLVGFPQEGKDPRDEDNRGHLTIRDFTARVDSTPLPLTYQSASTAPAGWKRHIVGWHTFRVPFAAGQTRTVHHTYLIQPTWFSDGSTAFTYILSTGAVWKGAIGQATLVVHPSGGFRAEDLTVCDPEDLVCPQSPRRYSIEKGALVWRFRQLEPSSRDDIAVLARPPQDRPTTGIFPSEAKVGDKLSYSITARYSSKPWPAGTRLVLYGGERHTRLAEVTLDSESVQAGGEFVLPTGLRPVHGRAIEVWGEVEPGGVRALSTLVYVEGEPQKLPTTGDSLPLPILGGVGLLCFALGLLARTKHRSPRER